MKKRLTIISILIVSIVIGVYLINNSDKVTLKSNVHYFEYGDVITFDNEDVLETSNPKILDSLVIDQSNIELEDDKKFPKVGEFNVSASYVELFSTKEKDFSIIVSDNTKPNFIKFPNLIKLMINDDKYDLLSYFVVEDLSDFEIKIDTSSVNFKKEGQYDVEAIASDKYGNESSQDFSILIEEEIVELPAIVDDKAEDDKPDIVLEEKPTSSEEKPVASKPNKDSEKKPIPSEEKPVDIKPDASPEEQPTPPEDKPKEPDSEIIPTIVNGILIVNKKHPLPASYSPGEDPTAIAQLKIMIKDMQNLGYDISNSYSGFRTYSYQKNLYERYVKMDGKTAADTYSARPGHSEHQTGLTYDLKHSDGTLVEKTSEAKWISENASNYGFIVRYKPGKEHITGYQAEPWHLRYIGNEATSIYTSGLTLEEYLGIEGGGYYGN